MDLGPTSRAGPNVGADVGRRGRFLVEVDL